MKKGVIIVLSLLVVGLGGYIVYDKCLNKTENTKTEEKKDNVVSLYVDDPIVKKIYSRFDILPFKGMSNDGDSDQFGYFFKKEKTLASDVPVSYKISVALLSMYDDEKYIKAFSDVSIEEVEIKNEDLENKIREIFGNTSFKNENLPTIVYGQPSFSYDEGCGCYVACKSCGFGGPYFISASSYVVKAEMINNKILNIYVKPEFVKWSKSNIATSDYPGYVYSDVNMTNLVATFNNEYEENHKSYADKLDTYKFSFEKDGSNYYFKSVEKVK